LLVLTGCQGGESTTANGATTTPANSAPTISGSPAATADVGAAYSFRPAAADVDGDPLAFSATGRPGWLQLNTSTGQLSGTPGASDVGSSGDITLTVSDGKASSSLTAFRITVRAATSLNRAPTISGQPPTTAAVGGQYSFQVVAADADGDTLTFSATGSPAWMSLNAATGLLSGSPQSPGTFAGIILSVSDGKATASLPAFTVTVTSGADTTRPTVAATSPSNGANGVSAGTAISVSFSEPIQSSTVSATTFLVTGVSGTVSASGNSATFAPTAPLTAGTTYTVTIKGGAGGIADLAGNTLAADASFSFTVTGGNALSCGGKVRCVGSGQPYATIQAGVDAAQAGDTVLVFDGQYRGFVVSRSGTAGNRITILAAGVGAVIDSANPGGEGVTINDSDYVTIQGFTVTGMPGYGIATHGATATSPMRWLEVRGNTVQNSGSANIYLSEVADSVIEANTATGSQSSHGIYLANGGSDDTVLRGNRCSGNAKNGIHFNGDLSIGGDGLHSGLTIDGNILYDNVANGLDMDGVQDSTVVNNVIYNNGRNGVRAFQIDAAAGPRRLTIVNNTVSIPAGGGWAVKLSEDGGGHVIFNNILLAADGSSGSIAVANTSFSSESNIVVDRFSLDGDSTTISLASWRASGRDAASAIGTAASLFVNAGGADYRLKVGAPAVDTGRGAFGGKNAPTMDAAGSLRPKGSAPDIGAYESF